MLAGTFHRPVGVLTVTNLMAIFATVPCMVTPVRLLVNLTWEPRLRLRLVSWASLARANFTASIMLLRSWLLNRPEMIALLMSWMRFKVDSCFVNLCCIIAQLGLLVNSQGLLDASAPGPKFLHSVLVLVGT
jgi:hypothetical protein